MYDLYECIVRVQKYFYLILYPKSIPICAQMMVIALESMVKMGGGHVSAVLRYSSEISSFPTKRLCTHQGSIKRCVTCRNFVLDSMIRAGLEKMVCMSKSEAFPLNV